jgi:two-component system, NtrC family, sensor kinase
MNTFTDTHAILTAFFDALPWPALMLDECGHVTFINREMQRTGATLDAGADTRLAALFPEYHAALRGSPPWLAPQTATIRRTEHGAPVCERLSLHPLPFGACLFVIGQPDSADGLQDAQLARLASLGFMVAGVCHELANPLTAISSTVQLLRASPACPPALLEKGLANIANNVQRMLNISRKLNDFSRADHNVRATLGLRTIVDDAVSSLRHDNAMRAIDVDCSIGDDAVVRGDSGQLQQVFCNVFMNAAQAMDGRGQLFISAMRPTPNSIEIAIRDAGPGISEPDLARLFEPFFTTKPVGQGTGLGLAISNEIVLSHGGSMRATNDARGGACFYIRLPAAS